MTETPIPEDYARAFVQRILSARRAAGLSQPDVAERLGLDVDAYAAFETTSLLPHHLIATFAGVTRSDIAHLITGRTHASTEVIEERLPRKPVALVMDFDGVFTDNRVMVDQDGREAVLCNRSDGLGLERLKALGLPLLVLSKERNPVVQARCNKLKIECLQSIDDKGPALAAWCAERGLALADVVFVGNDINDLPCLEAVGCAVAVADSYDEVLAVADVVLSRPGGHGALRELADALRRRLQGA